MGEQVRLEVDGGLANREININRSLSFPKVNIISTNSRALFHSKPETRRFKLSCIKTMFKKNYIVCIQETHLPTVESDRRARLDIMGSMFTGFECFHSGIGQNKA